MMTAPSDPTAEAIRRSVSGPIPERILIGGVGALISLGLGMIGILFWPHGRTGRVSRPQPSITTYDSVTGLPSQRLFLALVSQALSRAAVTGRYVVVLVVELTDCRLPAASPALQHHTLIARVQAARIKSVVQAHDSVARITERRFAVMLDNLESGAAALAAARALQASMSLPLLVEGQELLMSCRIGGAVAPCDGTEGDVLFDAAARLLSDRQTDDASIAFLSDPAALPSSAGSSPHSRFVSPATTR